MTEHEKVMYEFSKLNSELSLQREAVMLLLDYMKQLGKDNEKVRDGISDLKTANYLLSDRIKLVDQQLEGIETRVKFLSKETSPTYQ